MQWNEPSRTDYYLMQIARMLSTGEGSIDDLKIPFKKKTEEEHYTPEEESQARAKAAAKSKAFFGPLIAIAERKTVDGN